ncbi:hypothetical protein PLESTB_000192700 [Pleodorina starrii]|uniref:Non-specific serine/threonine protein kinase n=1 Tax=Pleodorina starrii TaxID=330485 RepID=A0A9W6BBP7_9CHLO|nr:hypothetical protein PLESTB_000192700 [Pleodorina starrii]GLC73548.1 hypothetical protein PLESTF_001390100 [Pleodorina starrii]
MAHEIPPQYRAVLNTRELPAHRAERLWALHAELSAPQGLFLASAWLPPAWPHLLQLLAEPHPEVRAAAVQLLGSLGAALAARRDPRLAGRMPPSALLDWGLALLSPASTLPAAQRMTTDAKEAALSALHVCVTAMPPPDVAPFAQPLLRLTTALLEATTTPPRLLGPLLRLLLAALPAVPLAALGQGFGDLADLLCGWALEPLVASQDRQLITLILHALRPQWHSHPDLTASLTENMLNDVKAAAASTAAAAAAGTAATEGRGDAAAQATACMQLVQLLCDIFSAASLRQLPLQGNAPSTAEGGTMPGPTQPQPQAQTALRLQQPHAVTAAAAAAAAPRGPQTPYAHPHLLQHHQLQQNQPQHPQLQQQQQQQQQFLRGAPPIPSPLAHAPPPRPPPPPAPPLALTAILHTRPGAAAVRHLVSLYARLLATLRDVRDSLVRLDAASVGRPSGADPWAARLCGCVEMLVDSVGSCVVGSDPRDVDEVWEGLQADVLGRLTGLTLREQADPGPTQGGTAGAAAASPVGAAPVTSYGAVGAVATAAVPERLGARSAAGAGSAGSAAAPGGSSAGDGGSGATPAPAPAGVERPPAPVAGDRGAALRLWALRTALQWAMELLSGACADGPAAGGARSRWPRAAGPGPDADALVGCAARLLGRAAKQDDAAGRRLLVEMVLEGEGGGVGVGVRGLRSSPQTTSVAAAAKLLQAVLSHGNEAVAATTLDWLLADLHRRLSVLQSCCRPPPPASRPRPSYSSAPQLGPATRGPPDGAEGGGDAANAAAFDCAVLQAACQRGLLASGALLRVEAATWTALHGPTAPAAPQLPAADPAPSQRAAAAAAGTPSLVQAPSDAPSSGGQGSAAAEGAGGSGLQQQLSPVSQEALPASVRLALCDTWAAAAVGLIALVHASEREQPAAAAPAVASARAEADGPLPAVSAAAAAPLAGAAVHSCCAAFLNAVHSLQTGASGGGSGGGTDAARGEGAGTGLQLRAISAIRHLLKSPAAATSGALCSEQLFRLAVDAVVAGEGSWDARVRAAAADCATALVTHVLRPVPPSPTPPATLGVSAASGAVGRGGAAEASPPLQHQVLPPPPPRPEAFAPLAALALDALADTSAHVAAAAARLAAELSEAALLAALRGPASYGTWAPAWHDALAVTPQLRAPRPQQFARLLELVFQSAAAQGSVLLRKRSPAASTTTGGGDDGDSGARMEALQRLALGMIPAEALGCEQACGGGVGGGGGGLSAPMVYGGEAAAGVAAAAPAAEGRSGAALVWLALQEGAKHVVASRLRTHLGGPTQTLGALERMLQVTYSRLCQERRDAGPAGVGAPGRVSAWLALELVGGLERAVAHAAEGHAGRDALPQPVLAFFAANKKVCEEWFTRGRELLARIASLASAHHHAAHHGLLRLRDMRGTLRQLLVSLAKERGKAAAAAAAAPTAADAKSGSDPQGAVGAAAAASSATPGGSTPAETASQAGQAAQPRQGGGKQLQRRAGHAGDAAAAAAAAAAAGVQAPTASATGEAAAAAGAASVPSAVQQLEGSLSRLALAVVEVLKLVGAALLAMGEADSLQGLHSWATREFEPLLQGAHLPGTSAVAAATAAAAAEALASGGAGLGGLSKRRPEAGRAPRGGSGSKQRDAFAWLLGLSLQAAGSYEQALLSYNAFLAPTQAPIPSAPAAPQGAAGSPGGSGGSAPAPGPSAALEVAAAAQGFVVERVAECYAALTDWSGLQGLVGAFSRTVQAEPSVAGWWPAAAASIEHKFRALAAFDTATEPVPSTDAVPGEPTSSALLAALRVLDGVGAAAAAPPPPPPQRAAPPSPPGQPAPPRPRPLHPRDLAAAREATSLEVGRVVERLRASALSEPAGQRELFLQASCLRSALRALEAADPVTAGGAAADGPWHGLLLPQTLRAPPSAAGGAARGGPGFAFGLGRALLTPDGGLASGVVRDVAVTAALLRAARAGDPRVGLAGTQALSLEHIRAAAATGNWSLAARLVQAAAARTLGPEVEGLGAGAGARVVLSVAHSLMSASSGRLMPGQVVELQLRALLPHLATVAAPSPLLHGAAGGPPPLPVPLPPQPRGGGIADVDADDMACALCTLARWMLKAGAASASHSHHHHHLPLPQQQQHPHPPPSHHQAPVTASHHPYGQPRVGSSGGPPGFPQQQQQQQHLHPNHTHRQQPLSQPPPPPLAPPGFAGPDNVASATAAAAAIAGTAARPLPGFQGAAQPQWLGATDWLALSSHLLRQLVALHADHAAPQTDCASWPGAQPAFLVPEALLQSCSAPSACCLRALQLSPGSARAWKAWGDLVYRATKEQRARAARPAPPPAVSLAAATSTPGGGGDGAPLRAGAAAAAATAGEDAHGTWAAVGGYGAAAVAYCRYLTLSYSHDVAARPEDVLPVLLQVLHIVVRHAAPLERLLEVQLAAVPPPAWAAITPQLLAQLPGASGAARRLLAQLLHTVGRAAPSLVLYPAVVEVRAADAAAAAAATAAAAGGGDVAAAESSSVEKRHRSDGTSVDRGGCSSMVPELRALLLDLGRSRPGLLPGVEVLVAEMERLTVLWDERWAALLAEVEVEIARRAVSLQAEAARVADDASLTGEQRQSLLSSRYSTLMAPAVMLLERQLRAMAATPPETPHERRFAASMLPRLRAAAVALRDGAGVRDWARPAAAWAPLRAAAAALVRQQRQPLPPMAELSPQLAALHGSDVPMPGCHGGDGGGDAGLVPWGALGQPAGAAFAAATSTSMATVTVAGVSSELVALATKTRPKRVALLGSDGRSYAYLLKGREDLRMDERLMQVLRAINAMLQADPAAAARGLSSVRCYSVTPLGPRAGLIQWVPATTSLFAVFRHWQAATLERHGAMVAARQEGVAKAAAEGAPPPPDVEPPPPAAVSRPMDLFYSTLVAALQERGLSSATPRRNWPADLLRSVFASLAAASPAQLLARALWAGGGSAALSWRRQQRYGRSLAVMSCVGHLLGLGDRHPDNILLEGREAGVVHIDYNVCWDKGAKLRVPEVVPFRLTQMLSTALGVGGLEGAFRAACEATFGCLRRRREALVGLADAVLSDPGVDWAVEREDMAARQDMELAVALNLFISRAEESQRQLQQAEEELPAVLEGPVGVLLSYVEAQAFGEAMRGAALEAQQRIQQAKSALEAASRAEAEAGAIVAAAAQEAASLAAEANALSSAVPQLLQQCGAWAQQHAGTLGVLRDGSFLEGTLASGVSWRAVESGCALGLLAPVQGPGHAPLTAAAPLALLPAVMGGEGSGLMQLPEELLLSCHECDLQAGDLLGRREAALGEAVAALTQYGTIVRKLLPPAYPASSYHHRWAEALAALAASGLALPAVVQAQALAPREPRPLDVAAAWQALRGAQRLATAAAVVLAPGSPDAAAAVMGHVAGARISGRELAGAVAAAGRAVGEALSGVAAEARAYAQQRQAAAAVLAGDRGGRLGISAEQLTRDVVELLQRHVPPTQRHAMGDTNGGAAVAAAAAAALLGLVQTARGRIGAVKISAAPDCLSDSAAGGLQSFVRLGGEVAGLAAAVTALADARLAAPVLGVTPGLSRGGGSSHSLQQYQQQGGSPLAASRAATPGLHAAGGAGAGAGAAAYPLPWLAAAADACGRWPELMQRLAADVAPELAGQLHLGSGGGGGESAAPPDSPLAQAATDLQALLRPVEDALRAGLDVHARLEALVELTATYRDRREDLLCRLAGGAASGLSPQQPAAAAAERESMESDLHALDAAWASREAVAAGLSAAAAAATEALAEALRRLYAAVLGPGRLPAELQPQDAAPAVYATGAAGCVEGWAEAGGCGHAAVAALASWWEAVTESLAGIQCFSSSGSGDAVQTAAGGGSTGAFLLGSGLEVPPGMRPLWRCVESVRLLGQSLAACGRGLRLSVPPGTDGALSEAYGDVLQALVRRAVGHAAGRLLPYLRQHLEGLEAQVAAAAAAAGGGGGSPSVGLDGRGRNSGGSAGGGNGHAAARQEEELGAGGAPELVPFTGFDPDLAGEGELLGGLEDEEDEATGAGGGAGASGDGAPWLGYDDSHDGASGGDRDDEDVYELDLGLDLDLDDGFGGGGSEGGPEGPGGRGAFGGEAEAESSSAEGGSDAVGRARRGAAEAAAHLPPASCEEVSTFLECLAACATAATVTSAAAALDPAAAAAVTTRHHGATAAAAAPAAAGWAAGPEARALRACRLQRLAAYEWMHEHHLLQALPAGDPRVGQALAQFFAAQAADPLQPSARGVTAGSRLALLTALQSALDALPGLEAAVSGWETASGGAVSRAVALLRGAPEQFPVDTALAAQRAGVLMGRRQQWLAESRAVVMRVCQVAEALLQFEYSRQGITWASGGAAVADGFVTHCQLLGRAEVLATLAAGGSEAGRAAAVAEASQRGAEAARKAADARYALEVAQYEEVAASSQLQAHLPQLVARSLELGAAVAEAEPAVRGLEQLLSSKLGPALKELSSVSAQHAAAADVASVAAVVMSHFERSRQAAEALSAALPATLAALAATDSAAPLPADMLTEVGFLSAQLLGGAEAAAVTRQRAMALLQHMAATSAALQPVVHTIAELPRALGQLSNELSTLAAAAGSIAAAVESKHLMPALEESQPAPQQQAQAMPPAPSAGASDTPKQHADAEGASSQTRAPAEADAGGASPLEGSHTASAAVTAASGSNSTAAGAGSALTKAFSATSLTASAAGAARLPLQRLAHAAATPDHVQHHRSRRSAADEARRRAFAAGAVRRFVAKLEGREAEGAAAAPAQQLSVPEQVGMLVRQATSADRLSQMYEGWTAWL